MSYHDDMVKAGRADEIGREPHQMGRPDLSYMAEEMQPSVRAYLDSMRDLAKRSWREGNQAAHSIANRAYYAAMCAISEHRWPL